MDRKLMLITCVVCWVLIGCSYAQSPSDAAPIVRIIPSSQKVADGSHVIFTCITNMDSASFKWGKPSRDVDENRDRVRITQLSPNVSVLEIPRAHVKRHKRTYNCAVSFDNGVVLSASASLKVMTKSRLHSNFPRIVSIRQEDKYVFQNAYSTHGVRVSSQLQCMTSYDAEAERTRKPLEWRWIRGGNSEITLTEDYQSGRIEVTEDGHLLINNPETSDHEASYICAAKNSWGTAYSTPFALNKTEAPTPEPATAATCTDRDGRAVGHGEMYKPDPEDPCKQCECFYGREGRCMSVSCQAPTCTFYEPSKEKCCEFTCIGEEDNKEISSGKCKAFSGELVSDGEIYHPDADPCVTCMCRQGSPDACASVSCIPPPMSCADVKPVPGTCCEFTCDDVPDPEPIEEPSMKKVLGHVYIQQVGSSRAIVHWKLPSSYDETMDKMSTFAVNVFRDLSNMADVDVISVTGRMYAILDDVDPNVNYYVMVNATSEKKTAVLMTRTETFSLKPRSSTGLVLSESVGQVFESRGAIRYTGYSLPRQFNPVSRQAGLNVVINVNAFHRVDVSSYHESPCPSEDCGLLRFYSYDMEGEIINHVSLMFVDDRDFLWAKSHL